MKKESYKDVHTEHCCILHGCKYGEDDCTVTTKRAKQSFLCESCSVDGMDTLDDVEAAVAGTLNRCPHCGHKL